MLQVSDAFMENATAPVRHVSCRAWIETSGALTIKRSILVDEYAGNTLMTQENDRGNAPQVVDGIQDTSYAYAMLDGTWTLDGTWALASRLVGKRGWVSLSMSDAADGSFANGVSMIIRTGEAFAVEKHEASILIAFDTKRREWAVDFDIVLLRSGTISSLATIAGNTQTVLTVPVDLGGVTSFDGYGIRVRKWSHPGRTIKVALCYYGSFLQLAQEDLFRISFTADDGSAMQASGVGTAPSTRLTLEASNVAGILSPNNPEGSIYGKETKGFRLLPMVGFSDELVNIGTFWVSDWKTNDQTSTATLTAQDTLALLDDEVYDPALSSLAYPCRVSEILRDALNQSVLRIGVEYPVDDLPTIQRPLEEAMSLRQLLKHIAVLLICRVVSTAYGSIKFIPVLDQRTPVLNIDMENYYTFSLSTSRNTAMTGVIVDYVGSDGETRSAFAGNTSATETTLHFPVNPLIQALDFAQEIAAQILLGLEISTGDRRLEWRGNPALLVGDAVRVIDRYDNAHIVAADSLTLDVSGGMNSTLQGRLLAQENRSGL